MLTRAVSMCGLDGCLRRNHREIGARKTALSTAAKRARRTAHRAGRSPSCGRISISHTNAQRAAPVPARSATPSTSRSRKPPAIRPQTSRTTESGEKCHYRSPTAQADCHYRPVVAGRPQSWFCGTARRHRVWTTERSSGVRATGTKWRAAANQLDPLPKRAPLSMTSVPYALCVRRP